jgi:hypothetical protein
MTTNTMQCIKRILGFCEWNRCWARSTVKTDATNAYSTPTVVKLCPQHSSRMKRMCNIPLEIVGKEEIPYNVVSMPCLPPDSILMIQNGKVVGKIINVGDGE